MGLIILLSTNTKAQYYYTSYGYTQDWYLPNNIQYSITDHYYGYDIAHVRRYTRHGHPNFNVLLHRNGWFVELRFDHHGHIYKTIRHRWHYPLTSHICTAHCGYHHTYYTTYYPKYHHTHYYAPTHTKTVYVNTHHGHKTQNNYYTNVYVDQQNNQPKYNGNNQGNRNSQSNVNNSRTQQRTNSVIHRPQSVVVRNVAQPKQQNNSSSNRIERNSSQVRSTRQLTTVNGSSRTTTNRNERGSRNR